MNEAQATEVINKSQFYDDNIEVIDDIPTKLTSDPENLLQRQVLAKDKYLRCANVVNRANIEKELNKIDKYLRLSYWDEHPRECLN